jgi:AraC-like DNA-binding protein
MYGPLDLLTFASSCSLITMGFVYLADHKSDRWIIFLLFGLWGIDTIMILWEDMGIAWRYSQLQYINRPFELFFGPLVYCHFITLIEGKYKRDLQTMLLFLPGALAVIFFIPFSMLPPQEKLALIGLGNITSEPFRFVYRVITRAVTPWLVFCILLFIVQASRALSTKSLKLMLRKKLLLAYCILWIVIASAGYMMVIAGQSLMIRIMIIVANFMLVLFYFIEKKHENIFLLIQKDSSETRYKKSMIKNMNTDAVIARVKELMEMEYLYLDENLSLQSLSSTLGITTHQLSEILNVKLNKTFRSYINTYRIMAAKRMLLENEDISILQAALSCGFNSKNTFNIAFHTQEGMTPTEFIEKNRKSRHDL